MEPRDTERVLGIISRTDEIDEDEAREFFKRYFDDSGSDQSGGIHYVVQWEEELVGVGGYLCDATTQEYWLGFLFIDPYFQGHGLGTLLLQHIQGELKGLGANSILAPLEPEDIPSQIVQFYEVNGFRRDRAVGKPPVMQRPKTIVFRKSLN
jgi:GNAT superfamily N-acetyltransferase